MDNQGHSPPNFRTTTQPIVLIGAGALCQMALDLWPDGIARPVMIVDSFKTGHLGDIPIERLEDHQPQSDVLYLLSAFEIPSDALAQIYLKLGNPPIATVYDLLDQIIPDVFSNGWSHLNPSAETRKKISTVRDCFTDEVSKAVFDAAVDWRYHRKMASPYPVIKNASKYDLARYDRQDNHYDVVYDGGSFDLSFLHGQMQSGITMGRMIAFEPDAENYQTCKDNLAELNRPVELVQKALGVTNGAGGFLTGNGMASRLSPDAPDNIDITTLDADFLDRVGDPKGRKSLLIKLHVEGAELDCLKGSRNLIENHTVDIFVNLTHNEAALLDIPVWLRAFGLYDLHLRAYSLFGEGLTLFARHQQGSGKP